jgi:hypothetical protein
MALTGLHNDYTPDGRVLAESLTGQSWQDPSLLALGRVYSQLDSSVGQFALDTLTASTQALISDTPGDAQYAATENQLIQLGAARDALVQQMRSVLDSQGLNGAQLQPFQVATANNLTQAGDQLLAQATRLSAS